MSLFITHVAALLWAATQVPEITVAIQSFLKTGFRSAVQVELLVITSYKWIPLSEFQKIVTTCQLASEPLGKCRKRTFQGPVGRLSSGRAKRGYRGTACAWVLSGSLSEGRTFH